MSISSFHKKYAPVFAAFLALPLPVLAQPFFSSGQGYFDGSIAWTARETTAEKDDDVKAFRLGYSHFPDNNSGLGFRGELSLGELDLKGNAAIELQVFQQTDRFRYGAAFLYDWAAQQGSGAAIALTGSFFYNDNWTLSGHVGYQGTERGNIFGAGNNTAPFGAAEVRWYPADWVSISGGAAFEADRSLGLAGIEFYVPNSRFSLFIDYARANGFFRGRNPFDSVTYGLRMSVPFGAVRDRDRITAINHFRPQFSLH